MFTRRLLVLVGLACSAATVQAADLTTLSSGEISNQQYAQTIINIGDINGDGIDDFAIGNSRYTVIDNNNGKKLLNAGRVQIFSGADDSVIWEKSGTAAKQEFGASVLAADLNTDGKVDIVIGAPGNYFQSGMVLLAVQQASSADNLEFKEHRIYGDGRGSRFGSALAFAPLAGQGSVNNLFLLVGSPREQHSPEWTAPAELQTIWAYSAKPHKKRVGAIFGYRINLVLNKPVSEVNHFSNMRIFGSAANSLFGSQLAWLPDAGVLAVSAPKQNKTGEVLLWDTDTNYSALQGINKGENFGQVLQAHGSEQLAVSAPLAANGKLKKAGRVDIYNTANWGVVNAMSGDIAAAEFGSAMASDQSHLLISSPKASNANAKQKQAGLLQWFATDENTATQLQWGENSGELFGTALAVHNNRVLVASPGFSSLENKKLKKIGRVAVLTTESIIE